MKSLVLLLVIMLCAACATFQSNATRDTRLDGEWTCVSAVMDGKSLSADAIKSLRLVITGTRYITRTANETLFDSTYRVDRTKTPPQIFMLGNEGALTGKEAQGIYDLSGDTLRICYAMPGDPAPVKFESTPGSKAQFIVWRRMKE